MISQIMFVIELFGVICDDLLATSPHLKCEIKQKALEKYMFAKILVNEFLSMVTVLVL